MSQLKIINTGQDYIHKYEIQKMKLYNCNANVYLNESCVRLYLLYYITIETNGDVNPENALFILVRETFHKLQRTVANIE